MAKFTEVRLIDDFDGGPATQEIRFSYRGNTYEIDLSDEHAREMDEILAGYMEVAHHIGGARSVSSSKTSSANTSAIREWARSQGMEVSERGRLSADVVAAYQMAHKAPSEAKHDSDTDEIEDL